jgi:esterase/lipase superfamily enzyme/Tfp pilus assembly protein PilF
MGVGRVAFAVLLATGLVLIPHAPTHGQTAQIEALSLEAFRLQSAGSYGAAVPLAERAVDRAKRQFGEKSGEHALYLHRLGSIYHDAARWDDAERVYLRALELREALDPANVAITSHDLGLLYDTMTKFPAAEPHLLRAVELYKKSGSNDDNLATSETALGLLYRNMGRFSDAERLMKAALATREKAANPKPANIANSQVNLAALYRQWGRFSEAETPARQALSTYKQASGPESLQVARALNVLAESLRGQGRVEEAQPVVLEGLRIRRAKLGASHPDVAASLNSAAGIYEQLGRVADAEKTYKQALALRQKLGPRNLNLATTRANLGALYKGQQRYSEAEPLLRAALAAREEGLGLRHPDVVTTLSLLGDLYRLRGQHDEAKRYFDRVLELRKDVIRQIPVLYGTDRERKRGSRLGYSGERAGSLSFGVANVWVPEQQIVEQAPRISASQKRPSPADEVTEPSRLVIQHLAEHTGPQFTAAARSQLAQAQMFRGQAVVFVHGFNVSFENAVKRAAQLGYDLNFDGPIFLYSWPSRGGSGLLTNVIGIKHYPYDLASADGAVNYLFEFLRKVSGVAPLRVHLIAHSMGNRALLETLHRVSLNRAAVPGLTIGEIICAAPDVDVHRFRQLIPQISPLGGKVTLYASSSDWALRISSAVWGSVPRAGLVPPGQEPIVLADLDSIDITKAGSQWFNLNHDVYAANPAIAKDVRTVLESGLRPPDKRPGPFMSKTGRQGAYWEYIFKKADTAANK